MSTAAALEPLRAANLFAGQMLYEPVILTRGGGPATASVGSHFDSLPLAQAPADLDLIFVVAGGDPLAVRDGALFAWLRRQADRGTALGAISGGAALLWRAGLLEGRRFTLHWHHMEALRTENPGALMEQRLFVIDRDRYTCAGGTAPLDMMHAIIARDHGSRFAAAISDWFIQTEVRLADAPQQGSTAARYGALPPPVTAALELMETHVADPLSVAQIAALTGLSSRQLQRLFHEAMQAPVAEVYRGIRLDVARDLVRRTRLPLAEVAQMTGFATQAHFSGAYSARHGSPPRSDRAGA
ncbi:GlxA family transcriptional regulator [Pseudooceanicola sp. CBS1P-1]|uniref:Helix-turn-helix domain-containing protein n=2 Tax=Paracoccaceae TaxID=31989 RepID=A0A6L7G603_9RHOB|nr:GlxA family transcriptional regulator [Pseudooceanicola endophyticus]MXN18908.1 helix-turn-helix domain-containing protein [Pseudooceanicola albus]